MVVGVPILKHFRVYKIVLLSNYTTFREIKSERKLLNYRFQHWLLFIVICYNQAKNDYRLN